MGQHDESEVSILREQLAQLNARIAEVARELDEAEARGLATQAPEPVTLAEFLLQRITEDEDAAQAAKMGPWRYMRHASGDGIFTPDSSVVEPGGYDGRFGASIDPPDGEHIVRWEPARVLAECEAKRLIVEKFQYRCETSLEEELAAYEDIDESAGLDAGTLTWAVRVLATPYAGHPDHRKEWRLYGT